MMVDQHQWDGAACDQFARSSRGRANRLGRAASSGAVVRSPVTVTTGLGALGNLVDAFEDYDPPSVGP